MSELSLTPSAMRRVSATLMLGVLGLLVLWVALRPEGPTFGWRIFLLVLGGGSLFVSWMVWSGSSRRLVLTEEALLEEDGGSRREICRISDIAKVERGTFAFKPSNGFVIHLKTSGQRAWVPGLWWRFGKRIGVGGVTPAGEGKAMADVLGARVAGGDRIA
ncbi:hypothetical protein [Celeribacter litoreus]|uniref:hypothetical protein n=1 Tax=Celeribacter litoreus TaxID=2876714 RepID=UPI001CCEC487|nr:hypothetical protein [Celeribacter litoreus]MCA0043010.1 hypothetical protein [Celeribacter litoreus]